MMMMVMMMVMSMVWMWQQQAECRDTKGDAWEHEGTPWQRTRHI